MGILQRMAAFYQKLPHQDKAWDYVEAELGPEKAQKALELFREAPVEDEVQQLIQSRIPLPGVDLIKKFEGCKLTAYPDPASGGLPYTIGWGSTRRKDGRAFQLGETITQAEADDLLNFQIENEFLPVLETIPVWSELNTNQRGALLSFAYNLGAHFYGGGNFQTISRVLREQRWDQIREALLLYCNPGSPVEQGLRRRRSAEADLFLSEASVRPAVVRVGVDWNNPVANVSQNFKVREVTQGDPQRIPRDESIINTILKLAQELDKVRADWGSPIMVTSWYRPPAINSAVGGVPNSQHITGGAADIYPLNGEDVRFEQWLDENWYGAIGYGVRSGRGFVHLDIRNGKGWKTGGEKSPDRWPY